MVSLPFNELSTEKKLDVLREATRIKSLIVKITDKFDTTLPELIKLKYTCIRCEYVLKPVFFARDILDNKVKRFQNCPKCKQRGLRRIGVLL